MVIMGLSINLRDRLILEQDNKCYYCSCEMNNKRPMNKETATFEHLIRVVNGGSNSVTNLVIACYRCNTSRDDVPPEVWKVICKKIDVIKQQRRRLKNKSKKRINRLAKRNNDSEAELDQRWLDRHAFVIPLITEKYTKQKNQIYIDHWPEGVLV